MPKDHHGEDTPSKITPSSKRGHKDDRNTANAAALKTQTCGYTKAAYVVDTYGDPASVNPDADTRIVGSTGIFSAAEYQNNSDFQKTAAVMKLVIDGNAAAGTIEMGGFDYHTGDRMTGEARDERLPRQQQHNPDASSGVD